MRSSRPFKHSLTPNQPAEEAGYFIRSSASRQLVISSRRHEEESNNDLSQYARFRYTSSQVNASDGVILRIHRSIIEESGFVYDFSGSETLVSDDAAGELMQGLIDTDCLPHMKPETVVYTVQMLCAQLLTAKHASQSGELRFDDWQTKEVIRLLRQAVTSDLSTPEIASQCGLSTCHFSRVFKATYGIPAYQFVLQERIKHAQSRLLSTEDSITDIALDCGFSDQSSFTRRFSAVTGTSPAAWRRQKSSSPEVQTHPGSRTSSSQFAAAIVPQ